MFTYCFPSAIIGWKNILALIVLDKCPGIFIRRGKLKHPWQGGCFGYFKEVINWMCSWWLSGGGHPCYS